MVPAVRVGGLKGAAWPVGLWPELGGWRSGPPCSPEPQPLGGVGHPRESLSRWHTALSCLSPVPFSGVKQEQLSPRGQAGPPESLGVPTAQETSVLRGTSLGSVPGGSISKGVPSTRVPAESPITYRGSITHVSAWGAAGARPGRAHQAAPPDVALTAGQGGGPAPPCPLCVTVWRCLSGRGDSRSVSFVVSARCPAHPNRSPQVAGPVVLDV